ncbi:MAG: hypothetical protein QUV04_04785 [Synechococcus sp. WH 8007]|nr:hypothetical protein [Synechococcus sp. WH 8007]
MAVSFSSRCPRPTRVHVQDDVETAQEKISAHFCLAAGEAGVQKLKLGMGTRPMLRPWN